MPEIAQQLVGQVEERKQLGTEEHEAETDHQPDDDGERPAPRMVGGIDGVGSHGAGEEHDGQHGDDAR